MKVLLIDDSEIVRERLKAILSEVTQVEGIDQAKDAVEAIHALKRQPDVVILDIQMPGGSGLDLLRKIKKGSRPPLVIVLTNLSYPQYRKKCLEAGADFFFDKSADFDRVAEVLRKASNPAPGRGAIVKS